jgi:CHAT domain-containing protein/Tfp pilus assembly protein PilF
MVLGIHSAGLIAIVSISLSLAGCGVSKSFSQCCLETERQIEAHQLDQALTSVERCQRFARSQEDLWRAMILKTEVLARQRNLSAALSLLEKELPPEVRNNELEIQYRLALGYARVLAGNRQGSKDLERARDLSRELRRSDLEASALLRLSGDVEDPRTRANELRRALTLAQGSGRRGLEADIRGAIGFDHMRAERFSEAVDWFETVLTIAEQMKASGLEGKTLGNISWCYLRLGEPQLALEASRRAAKLAEANGNVADQLMWLNNTGIAQYFLNRRREAGEAYQSALAAAQKHGMKAEAGMLLNNLSFLAIGERDFAQARRWLEEANRHKAGSGGKWSRLYSLLSEALILAGESKPGMAEAALQKVEQESEIPPSMFWEVKAARAGLSEAAGRLEEAERHYRSLMASIDHARARLLRQDHQLSFPSGLIRFYQQYVDFLLRRSRSLEALLVSDLSRVRELDARLGGQGQANTARLDPVAIARARQATLLIYWLAQGRSRAWVIGAGGVEVKDLPGEEVIAPLVEEHAHELKRPPVPGVRAAASASGKLREILIDGVLPGQQRGGRFIIIADGALHRLNFETLPADAEAARFWIDDATILRAPSLASLSRAPGGARPAARLLAIGNADLTGANQPPLPRAGEELAVVAGVFGSEAVDLVEGIAAKPSAYFARSPERFGFLHFATHAVSNEMKPLDSAILLSADETGYRLYARDILRRPLRAKLVTLAACHSAGTRTYRGTGLVGLSWAFLRAGAEYVIAGLWEINDSASLALSRDLYRLIRDGASAEEALRQAKRNLMTSNSPLRRPYYWGPWILMTGRP